MYEDAFTGTEDKWGSCWLFVTALFSCFPTAEHAGYVIPIEARGTKGLFKLPSAWMSNDDPLPSFPFHRFAEVGSESNRCIIKTQNAKGLAARPCMSVNTYVLFAVLETRLVQTAGVGDFTVIKL